MLGTCILLLLPALSICHHCDCSFILCLVFGFSRWLQPFCMLRPWMLTWSFSSLPDLVPAFCHKLMVERGPRTHRFRSLIFKENEAAVIHTLVYIRITWRGCVIKMKISEKFSQKFWLVNFWIGLMNLYFIPLARWFWCGLSKNTNVKDS